MADLRWILLLAGLVFLAVLAAWEMRRPRQARRDTLNPPDLSGRRSEPEMGELSAVEPVAPRMVPNERIAVAPLQRVDLPPLEPHLLPDDQPMVIEAPVAELNEPTAEAAAAVDTIATPTPVQMIELPPCEPPPPVVEWPPESERHIISVRLVGVNPDRMSGRPLRQALSACGFVHGRFGIFHQPGADGRALISAANLSKPGVFDPGSMDFQRFKGLGLFAVLPGPLPPAAALDHLLDTAGDLAQRLQARLQDEHGLPLDQIRLEALSRTVQQMNGGALHAEPAA